MKITKDSLPGTEITNLDVFDIPEGSRVLDKKSGKTGVVFGIKETQADCLDLFIMLDGETKERPVYRLDCVLLEFKSKQD